MADSFLVFGNVLTIQTLNLPVHSWLYWGITYANIFQWLARRRQLQATQHDQNNVPKWII